MFGRTVNTSRNSNKRALLVFIIVSVMVMISFISTMEVNAAGAIDWGTAVPITENAQVVDSFTLNGKTVQAIYAPRANVANYDSDETYCCAAFVRRFYNSVYGIDVWNLYPGNQPSVSSGYFYITDSPQPGDIAANSEHWAIVKSNSGGAVKLIEQNAWNSKFNSAMVGRTLYSGSGYWYWRWSGADNAQSAPDTSCSPSPAYDPEFSFSLNPVSVSSNNAVIKTTVSNPKRTHVREVGCYIYDNNGNLIRRHTESCSRNESIFYIWYDINDELGLSLQSNTTYYYTIFAIYDGQEYTTEIGCFKTK